MDVQEEKYRRMVGQYRSLFINLLNESPVPSRKTLQPTRNLKYIASKALLTDNYPFHNAIYTEALEDIKAALNDPSLETKSLGLRLGRALPFLFRIKLIELCENQIVATAIPKKEGGTGYGYETGADLSELLMSVFEVTSQSEDIYFDVNQRIITCFSRYLEGSLQSDRNALRNGCEVLRTIFYRMGYTTHRIDPPENKLIAKLISNFLPCSSFVNKQDPSLSAISISSDRMRNNARLLGLLLRCRELQVRVRARQLYGFCCLGSYFPEADCQILELLGNQILTIAENISQCDVLIDCFSSLAALVRQQQPIWWRNVIVKRWASLLQEIPFRKEYLQHYILLLDLCSISSQEVPRRIAYDFAIYCIELTRHLQQQYSRYLIYVRACRIILEVSRNSYKNNPGCNLLIRLFQYDWLIQRINQDSDLFKSQFLTALLHQAISSPISPTPQHLLDLLDLWHRLIDWRCTSKEETHVPTVKFAFDMYLVGLGWACRALEESGGFGVEGIVEGLISRCNDSTIYIFFKFKLIGELLKVKWYRQNHNYLQSKLSFQFIEDEVRVVMMPKNPKPIFSYDYSLTYDGQIESRKQIEYIKIIMDLLINIPKIHEALGTQIQTIIVDYHRYLSELQTKEDANKELINCLQTLEADYYFNAPQRHFLLAALPSSPNLNSLNYQTNLEDQLLFSPTETFACEEEVNVFGPMSPVQLTIRVFPHSSYSCAYIHIRKNQWVQTQNQLKLVVSSGIEKKQIPFESSILEIRVDRVGALHFEVWKGMENQLLLGSGSYRIRRKLKWLRADHLNVIDGIHTKAYFKEEDASGVETYLSCFFGEPLLVQVMKREHEMVVGVPNKQIYNQLRDIIPELLQQLSSGTAELLQNN